MSRFVKLAGVALLGVAVTGATVLAGDEEGKGKGERHRGPDGGDHHARMKKLDTDNDQKVSFEEFKAGHMKRMTEMFKKLDKNGDGFLSREDHQGGGKGKDADRGKGKGKVTPQVPLCPGCG